MNRDELATRLAKQTGVSRAAAADRLDEVIHRILTKLRRGQPAALPGLGEFLPGRGFRFEARKGRKQQ
ncbi:MAG: HU family DNA-binding protein [Rhodospirillales bacterium]